MSLLVLAALAAACGSAPRTPAADEGLRALQAVGEPAVGSNRFAFALETPGGALLADAAVRVDFYALGDGAPEYKGTASAQYRSIAVQTPTGTPTVPSTCTPKFAASTWCRR